MPNRVRSRRRIAVVTCSLASLLLVAIVLLCIHQVQPVDAGVFGRKKTNKDANRESESAADDTASKEADKAAENEIHNTNKTTESSSAKNERVTAKIEESSPPSSSTSTTTTSETTPTPPTTTPLPTRPPSIVEAEARTARELSHAVRKLTRDLQTCNTRVDAIEEGFQNLYVAHLGNVDGLRKCREGMILTPEDIEKLDDDVESLEGIVNPALLEQAQFKEDQKARTKRDEELASKHRNLINSLETRIESLVRRERSWERTISELQARRDLLERREGAWERTIGDLMGEIEVRARREDWWEDMKREMEGRIGTLSQIAVVERFGRGPHHVAMTVLLEEGNPSSQRTLIFELAPIELAPHSVHLFLSQIAEGYWSRGTPAIVLNAEHVLQACPHPCLDSVDLGGRTPGYPYEDMRAAGLDVVSFQEYSPAFPHEKYTIGFAGRPHSGPEFYINLLDNTLDHGTLEERKRRMGQAEYDAWAKEAFGGVEEVDVGEKDMMEPYPCFGKLVEGFDVVDEIAQGLTRASLPKDDSGDEDDVEGVDLDENMLLRPVKIASVTILENYSPGAKSAGVGEKKEKEGGSKTTTTDEL
mmetsp:Transcript_415/g.673  ORF Transcript_415/g.673 Transcript_415/m.673 type:complete len:589 (-) Transcript_415:163-1929(-)